MTRYSLALPPARLRTLVTLGIMLVLLATTTATAAPAPVGAADGPKAYIGLFKDNAVAVLDTATGSILGTIAVPPGPHGMAVTPDGRKVYVASDGATTVSAIETGTDTVARTIEVGKEPHGATITPDGRTLLVGVWADDQLAFLDVAGDEVTGRVSVPRPHNIAVTPDGSRAYVGSQAQGAPAIVIVDLATRAQVGSVAIEGNPRGLSFSPDGAWLYLTLAGSDDVLVLDPTRDEIVSRIAIGPSPHFPTFTATGLGLVDSQGLGRLASLDPTRHAVVGTVAVGERPHWTASTTDGLLAVVTNEGSNDATLVDLTTLSVRATVPVGNAPRKVVIQPGVQATMAAGPSGGAPAEAAPLTPPAGAPLSAPAPAVEARIERFAFSTTPAIAPGQPVIWTNGDSVPHSATGLDRSWDSGELVPGATFSMAFEQAGTYAYHCTLHPYMRAELIVS